MSGLIGLFLMLGQDHIWITPHFEIRYRDRQTTFEEAREVGDHAEAFYKRLEEYLGRGLDRRIVIGLEGDRRDEPGRRWPYVDTDHGWMHLFRFPEDTYPYQTGLGHELVHAYRFEHLSGVGLPPAPAFVFLEEGLAEYLSIQIEPGKKTFSTYGFELDIVAGQWLESDEYIPLGTLLADQWQLRPKCIAQAYTEQPSFIHFIESRLGRDVVRRLAYAGDIRDEASFTAYLGAPFATWVSGWEGSLLDRYRQIPDHDRFARQWRSETPAANLHVCKRGRDF
jgi:hypothetical protein